ncbi:MAG TPA: divalent-cation tolerance protein CutA [Gammaproteobacteria bacterium]|nr:divalent-cation tolerance protein CutA [Gammaproteobacteria bacterium]
MATNLVTLLCTCPDTACGERIAAVLVEKRLAACVNLVPGVRSFYRWQGQARDDQEILLIIKTAAGHFDAIEALVHKLHPYDVPELIALPITAGARSYLDWLRAETS